MKNEIRLPVLFYIFRIIERSLKGQPTLVIIDEAWAFLKNKAGKSAILEWLKVFRIS